MSVYRRLAEFTALKGHVACKTHIDWHLPTMKRLFKDWCVERGRWNYGMAQTKYPRSNLKLFTFSDLLVRDVEKLACEEIKSRPGLCGCQRGVKQRVVSI